jgi:hypothetical protein
MMQQKTKRHDGLAKTPAVLFAECGGALFPFFHMPVRTTGWSVEPGDGCRGIPLHGAIRFDLLAEVRGASAITPFPSRLSTK